jgi:hypothetical protein
VVKALRSPVAIGSAATLPSAWAGIARASMARKIAIVGAGAVGGYAGAHMVRAGEDVERTLGREHDIRERTPVRQDLSRVKSFIVLGAFECR